MFACVHKHRVQRCEIQLRRNAPSVHRGVESKRERCSVCHLSIASVDVYYCKPSAARAAKINLGPLIGRRERVRHTSFYSLSAWLWNEKILCERESGEPHLRARPQRNEKCGKNLLPEDNKRLRDVAACRQKNDTNLMNVPGQRKLVAPRP